MKKMKQMTESYFYLYGEYKYYICIQSFCIKTKCKLFMRELFSTTTDNDIKSIL